jgi:hypothetical protein
MGPGTPIRKVFLPSISSTPCSEVGASQVEKSLSPTWFFSFIRTLSQEISGIVVPRAILDHILKQIYKKQSTA